MKLVGQIKIWNGVSGFCYQNKFLFNPQEINDCNNKKDISLLLKMYLPDREKEGEHYGEYHLYVRPRVEPKKAEYQQVDQLKCLDSMIYEDNLSTQTCRPVKVWIFLCGTFLI